MPLTETGCNGNKGTFLCVQSNTDIEVTVREVAPKKSSSEILNELFSSLNSKQASFTDSENQTDNKTDSESVITSVRKSHKKRKHKVKKHKKCKSDESNSGSKESNNKVKRKSKKKSKKSKDKHKNDRRMYTCNSSSSKDEENDLTAVLNFDGMAEENTSVNVDVETENRIGIELRNSVERQDGSNNARAVDVESLTVDEKSCSRSSRASSSHDKNDDDKIQKVNSSEREKYKNDLRPTSRDHSSSRKRSGNTNEKRKHTPRQSPKYRNRSKDRHRSRNRSGSRHRSRSYTKRRHKSRSYTKGRDRSRSHSKARSRSRNCSKNRRSRSYSRSRRRSRSLSKRRHRSRTSSVHNGRLRSRSLSARKSRYKIRSKSRRRSRSRSRFRSRSRSSFRFRSRQQSRSKEYRNRGRSKSRSCSKSCYRRQEQDASRRLTKSRSQPRYQPAEIRSSSTDKNGKSKIDKQKLLEIARKNAITMLEQGALPENIPPIVKEKVASFKSGGKTVDELTNFCKQLSRKEETCSPDKTNDDSYLHRKHEDTSGDEVGKIFHHPFQMKDKPLNIVMNIRNSVQLPTKTAQEKTTELSKQLRLQFPVSSSERHRDKRKRNLH